MKNKILCGDALDVLKALPEKSVDCCVTSPPYYGLRDYGVEGQIGLEETPEAYVARLVDVFREVRRVLKDDGTLWLNIGDSYAGSGGVTQPQRDHSGDLGSGDLGTRGKQGHSAASGGFSRPSTLGNGIKHKDLIGIPWLLAFALRADGWYLRQDIIWHKPNPMPESVTDRCTKSHEYIFLLSKSARYYFNNDTIKEPAATPPAIRNKSAEGYQADYANGDRFSVGAREYGSDGMRNRRDVWTVATKPYSGAHFAVFPPDLICPCILAGSPVGGMVMDPFIGSGTTAIVALQEGRDYLGIEINKDYICLAEKRIAMTERAGVMEFERQSHAD